MTPVPLRLAAKGLIAAWTARHPGEASPLAGLSLALSWSLVSEGAWTAFFVGTNNYGSIHATQAWADKHAGDAGYGMVAFLDHSPAPYVARMAVYPSLLVGADAFLDLVERDVDLASARTPSDFATGLYVHGYYGGFHPSPGTSEPAVTPVGDRPRALADGQLTSSDTQNIADGAALVSQGMAKASAAIADAVNEPADPAAITVGPPFATLAERLSPSDGTVMDYRGQWVSAKPHTLDHVREILGPFADKPPRWGITLSEALSAPSGDGVWIFKAPAARTTAAAAVALHVGAILVGSLVGAGVGVAAALVSERAMRTRRA